jgi:hypothetical protein
MQLKYVVGKGTIRHSGPTAATAARSRAGETKQRWKMFRRERVTFDRLNDLEIYRSRHLEDGHRAGPTHAYCDTFMN